MKCFAIDVDGTLINSHHEMTPLTLKVLVKCQQLGHKVVIATGRNKNLTSYLFDNTPLKPDFILNTGHEYLSYDGSQHYFYPMEKPLLRQVLEILVNFGYHITIHTDKGKYSFLSPDDFFDQHIAISEKKHKQPLNTSSHIAFYNKAVYLENYHQVKSIEMLLQMDLQILKIDSRNINNDKIRESIPYLDQITGLSNTTSYEGFYEFTDNRNNKATMLKEYIDRHNISKEDTYTFGDSMNDLELFTDFKNSCAMGNARPEIKKLARWITEDNDHDGVAIKILSILEDDTPIKAPFKLQAAYKDYLWGGTKLKTHFNKQADLAIVAESWEASCHPDGPSIILDGPFAKTTLTDYLKNHPDHLGTHCAGLDELPILVKFIDAKDDLSIQVHPNDAQAKELENDCGKTEMWVIVDHDPNSTLYFGLNQRLTPIQLESAVKDNTICDKLRQVTVEIGDVFFIEAGTIHAIGAGNVICEIQENSNITYRLYDFDRKGIDGNPRPLHIDKAVQVAKMEPSQFATATPQCIVENDNEKTELLHQCQYFTVCRTDLKTQTNLQITGDSFTIITLLKGECRITWHDQSWRLVQGETLFIPAQNDIITVTGNTQYLSITV